MKTNFDVIVLGVGSMGSSACYYLSKQGLSVLGLEQFDIPHDQGSHAGQSRIIRKAYFEHPDYVPLLQRAYINWRELERVTRSQIYFDTGLLYAGRPHDTLIKGVKESADKYNIGIETLSRTNAISRFPQFQIPDNYEVLFEPDAGFVTPERAVLLFVDQAIKLGATIKTKEKVISWSNKNGNIEVVTGQGSYRCDKLVITAGPWAGMLIPGFSKQLRVTRQVLAWVNPKEQKQFELGNFPCWLIDDETQNGMYYGFPILPVGAFGAPIGLKVALHYPGQTTQPDMVNRTLSMEDEKLLIDAMAKFLPSGYSSTHVMKTCLYTNSPDEDFIIDFLPGHNEQVVIAAGFSGHGFKFASAVGEVLSDLAIQGKTSVPIGFLSAQRLSLQN